jgi:hypothetical protein
VAGVAGRLACQPLLALLLQLLLLLLWPQAPHLNTWLPTR